MDEVGLGVMLVLPQTLWIVRKLRHPGGWTPGALAHAAWPLLWLGQAAGARQTLTLNFALIGAAVLAMIIIAAMARKLLLGPRGDDDPGENFTIADLRELHQQGKISDAEFERGRASIIARSRATLSPDAEGGRGGEPQDHSDNAKEEGPPA